ncbi:unnamed protein product [Lathyrus oleraceus]|uniref:KIB1-4 beta-propeller domain-containing protein n=1 Tax=Pisum sativum TaxID=3888 RepID=A0A9D4Y6T9_PEA|nr:uncharacterized protein LOC127118146 [Pisum sativum]XP_050904252.1 uncharacterized protein LOC127118146 [Pisum sativum]KAI5434083.1 hypothetical protein KIW84_021083 [Pisum sativum]
MERDWANLEALALSLILDKLYERVDQIWFGAVCKNWLSVLKLNHQNHPLRNNVLPMLMIPKTNLCLYGISSNTTYEFQFPIPYYDNCCGCSHGWITTIHTKYHAYSDMDIFMDIFITMFNPFKSVSPITLPPLRTCPDYYEGLLPKVTLSADPITSPNDYVVAVIYTKWSRLSILKSGQTSWTYIGNYNLTDVIVLGDFFYVLTQEKRLLSFNLSYLDDPDRAKTISPSPVHGIGFHKDLKCYLVKSLEGDVWLVRKFLSDSDHNGLIKFEVYRFEFEFQRRKVKQLVKLESLGDNVLFVGECDSISASASHFSGSLKQDSIYYINKVKPYTPFHQYCEPFNVVIYNVKDESICHQNPEYSFVRHMPTPCWVLMPLQ